MQHANPYIPVDVENPSMAKSNQKHLKVHLFNNSLGSKFTFSYIFQGITKEQFESMNDLGKFYYSIVNQKLDEETGARGYESMSNFISYER